MMVDTALTRRIKRHVIGPVQSFFAATAPGLEDLCFRELAAMPGQVRHAAVVPGGVAFDGRLTDMYCANLDLRTPTRILMRIARFTASNFRQLERHLMKIPWELHIPAESDVKVSVTAVHSRLYHKAAVAERFTTAIGARLASSPPVHSAGNDGRGIQILLVRAQNDNFVVSLDSSGEPLYKRGLKVHGGKAPLRENLAAAALLWAGYSGREPLLDPMCGSGTFSLEAALVASHTPPGWQRRFAFMNWPAFKTAQWRHLKKERSRKITPLSEPSIFASDIDPGLCTALSSVVRQHGLSQAIWVRERDFFEIDPSQSSRLPGVVTLNPPYGIRLGSIREMRNLYSEIATKLSSDYRGWRVAVFLPDRRLTVHFPRALKQRRLGHGGLNLTLLTGRID